jgi:hypothetical protein
MNNFFISIAGMVVSVIMMIITGNRKRTTTNDFFYRLSFVLFSLFLCSLLSLIFVFMYDHYFVKEW